MKHMLHCCSRPVAVFFFRPPGHWLDTWYYHKISKNNRGDTKKTMTFDTDDVWSFPDFSILFQNVLWRDANGQDGSPSTAFKCTQSYVRQGFRDRDGVGLGFWPGDLWGRDVAIEGFGDTEEVEVDHPHHCGQAPVSHGSGKHCPHPLPAAWRVRQFTSRFMGRRRGGKRQSGKVRFSRRRRTDLNDDKAYWCQLSVADLRYSQLSIKDRFQCGRTVRQLIRDLWFGSIKVTAPFLRLTVFETTDRKTGQRILRCIDNRRLFALKEFAGMTGEDDLMVTVNLYSQTTIMEVLRFIQNSDDTPGDHVHLGRQKTFP